MVKKPNEVTLEQACALASALVDGDLPASDLDLALTALDRWPEGRLRWQEYHLVGEVMRFGADGATPGGDLAFLQRLRQRLQEETPRPAAWMVPGWTLTKPSANDARWRMVGAVLSLAVLAVIGWTLAVPGFREAAAPQLARAPGGVSQALALRPASDAPLMIRDPRLDELIAAHQQMGGASALQMPTGFLRSATFERPATGGGR